MPVQSLMAFVHVPPSTLGHEAICHPASASGTSSLPDPHVLSLPPHAFVTVLATFAVALPIAAAVFASVRHVVPCGSLPLTTLPAHALSALPSDCRSTDPAVTIAARHFWAALSPPPGVGAGVGVGVAAVWVAVGVDVAAVVVAVGVGVVTQVQMLFEHTPVPHWLSAVHRQSVPERENGAEQAALLSAAQWPLVHDQVPPLNAQSGAAAAQRHTLVVRSQVFPFKQSLSLIQRPGGSGTTHWAHTTSDVANATMTATKTAMTRVILQIVLGAAARIAHSVPYFFEIAEVGHLLRAADRRAHG